MKKLFLVLALIAGLFVCNNVLAETYNCYPDVANYWTGYCVPVNYKSGETVKVKGGDPSDRWYGWMKFNTSSIPDGAIISVVKLHAYISHLVNPNSPTWITIVSNDPVPASGDDLIADILDGSCCYYNASTSSQYTWEVYQLNNYAINSFQTSYNQGTNWFAVGFKTTSTSWMDWIEWAGYNGGANKPYITVTINESMVYSSSTVTQNTDNVLTGQSDQHIIGMEIVTTYQYHPISVTKFVLNTTGTTSASDISNAKIFYTGTSGTFATTNQFGSTVVSPSGNFTIYGTQVFAEGTNYFWLTYDISDQATLGNYVDAQCSQITVNGSHKTPTLTNPAGARKIIKPDDFPGTALDFDGANDYVGVGYDYPTDYTYQELWFKADAIPSKSMISLSSGSGGSRDAETTLKINNNSHIEFKVRTTGYTWHSLTGSASIQTGEWHHIFAAYCNSGVKYEIWLDGNLDASDNGQSYGNLHKGSSPLLIIGNRYEDSDPTLYPFDGVIDEVRIWNVARTAPQIRENMHKTLSCTESGLVGYWQFNEGSGTTAEDIVGGNNGTLYNMNDDDWITSTIPIGEGVSDTQTEAIGTVDFTGTDLSMDFTSVGVAEITVTRIDTIPNTLPLATHVLNDRYWVVNRFGSGTFSTNLTFTLPSGYLNVGDNQLILYKRDSNSDGAWENSGATLGIVTATTVQFTGITSFSQLIIGSDSPQNVTISIVGTNVQITWDEVPGATSYKVYSSNNPYTGFTEDVSGNLTGTSWTAPLPGNKKFYYVKAVY